jgi:hypothetical protein
VPRRVLWPTQDAFIVLALILSIPKTWVPLACQCKTKNDGLGWHWQASGTTRISVRHQGSKRLDNFRQTERLSANRCAKNARTALAF